MFGNRRHPRRVAGKCPTELPSQARRCSIARGSHDLAPRGGIAAAADDRSDAEIADRLMALAAKLPRLASTLSRPTLVVVMRTRWITVGLLMCGLASAACRSKKRETSPMS